MSFLEFTAPARDAGSRFLRRGDAMWIFLPRVGKSVRIQGHMLRQGIMGSDFSYGDASENPSMVEDYDAALEGVEEVDDRPAYVLYLTAKRDDLSYQYRRIWIDTERWVPLKQDLFARSGKLRPKQVKLFGIKNKAYAQRMAYRFLIDALYRFSIYKFVVSFKHFRLETGDVVTLSDNHLLSNEKVRIMNVQEDRHGRGLAITAIEDYAVHYPSIGFSSQSNLFQRPGAVTLADGTIEAREDPDQAKLYLSVTPGNDQINGFYVYRSYDDATYQLVGRTGISGVTGGAANSRGTILGSLPAHEVHEWAPTEWFDVDIGTLTDLATASTEDEFWHDRKLAKIGSEIIAYKTVREIAAGIWRVSDLRRGLFRTDAVAHSASESFATLDRNFTYTIQPADISQTLYFKVLAYYGNHIQQLSDVTGQAVTIQGKFERPAEASFLRLASDETARITGNYSGSSFTLYWNLGATDSGHNENGFNVSGGGGPFNHYLQDPALQAVILKFEETDGTPIGQREISVANSETITLATDLGGHSPAVVKVVPRRTLPCLKEAALTVTQT